MSDSKPIIGLAGGIGSGKSTVAKHMASMGGRVIDADAIARSALRLPEIRDQLIEWWGRGILDARGEVDRRRLADLVFDDPPHRQRLEGLIHPLVAEERQRLIDQAQNDPDTAFIVLDVPLLFEVGLDRICDRVVFVAADWQTRLSRLAGARGWDEAELDRREKNQMPLDRKLQLAHDILDNTKGEAECLEQVRSLLSRTLDDH